MDQFAHAIQLRSGKSRWFLLGMKTSKLKEAWIAAFLQERDLVARNDALCMCSEQCVSRCSAMW